MSLLIEVDELATILNDESLRLIDTRFSLQDTSLGKQQYLAGYIPGAIYADLEQDLSGTIVPGVTGRHPLPDPVAFSGWLQSLGITEATRVVIYDDGSHAMAARCWWLLEWAGHSHVSLLHGGFNAWVDAGLPITREIKTLDRSDYRFLPCNERIVSADELLALSGQFPALLDARGKERFAGREEPIDPVAGHIPGATCMPFTENMDENGRFLSPDLLAERFSVFYPQSGVGEDVLPVCYCGSGVTACHNILAMRLAGLPWPKLYPGSWSEWITDASRPVETGD